MTRYLISFDDGWMDFPDVPYPETKEVLGGFAVRVHARGRPVPAVRP
jgi:hypothetical protein